MKYSELIITVIRALFLFCVFELGLGVGSSNAWHECNAIWTHKADKNAE